MILEAYCESQFSDRSHGFRSDRGCHTALNEVVTHWTGVRWFVEGDIKGRFDNIDHDVLLAVLGEKLHDNRFLRLLKFLLKGNTDQVFAKHTGIRAGVFEVWTPAMDLVVFERELQFEGWIYE